MVSLTQEDLQRPDETRLRLSFHAYPGRLSKTHRTKIEQASNKKLLKTRYVKTSAALRSILLGRPGSYFFGKIDSARALAVTMTIYGLRGIHSKEHWLHANDTSGTGLAVLFLFQ
jgi:hypothetical protein